MENCVTCGHSVSRHDNAIDVCDVRYCSCAGFVAPPVAYNAFDLGIIGHFSRPDCLPRVFIRTGTGAIGYASCLYSASPYVSNAWEFGVFECMP
jgi:hypothetical protein